MTSSSQNNASSSPHIHSGTMSSWLFAVFMAISAVFVAQTQTSEKAIWLPKQDLPKFGSTEDESFFDKRKLQKIYERTTATTTTKLLKGPETPIIDPITGILYVLTEDANLVSLTDFQEDPNLSEKCKIDQNCLSAKATLVADLGAGRPLGGAFAVTKGVGEGEDDSDNDSARSSIYIADTLLGLIRVSNINDAKEDKNVKPKVEIIKSSFIDAQGNTHYIRYANDVDVGPKTGHVYFTDSSSIPPERITKIETNADANTNASTNPVTGENVNVNSEYVTWDTMSAFKRDLIRGEASGRLLRYKPETDSIDVLLDGLWFANGVAVNAEETHVNVVETSMARVLRYSLERENDDALARTRTQQDGTLDKTGKYYVKRNEYNNPEASFELVVDEFPGFPDGATCSRVTPDITKNISPNKATAMNRLCFVAIPSPQPPLVRILHHDSMPEWLSYLLRTLLLRLPSSVLRAIKPVKYGGVAVVHTGIPPVGRGVMRLLQDVNGEDMGMVTGVAVDNNNNDNRNKLFMGSLTNDFVAVYDLEE